MPTLLENLQISLEETIRRMELLEKNGVLAISKIYTYGNYNPSEMFHNLRESLPREIDRLQVKIRQLKNEESLKRKLI